MENKAEFHEDSRQKTQPCPLCGNSAKPSITQNHSWKNVVLSEHWCQPCGIKFQTNKVLTLLQNLRKKKFRRTRRMNHEIGVDFPLEVRPAFTPARQSSLLPVEKEVTPQQLHRPFHLEIEFSQQSWHMNVHIEPSAIVAGAGKAVRGACRLTIKTLDKTSQIVQDVLAKR